jgi:lysophospholipase L1-like esterase
MSAIQKRKRGLTHGLTLALVAVTALTVGTLAGRYRVFPYQIFASIKHAFFPIGSSSFPIPADPDYLERLTLFYNAPGEADVVMVGDSIVARGDWVGVMPHKSVANRAIDGDTTSGLRARLQTVLRLHPAVVFVMIGVNDFLANRNVDEVYADYLDILDQLSRSGVLVVVQATLRVGTINPYFHELNTKIDRLNGLLEQAAGARGLPYFDTNSALAPDGALIAEFTEDGVHLNSKGYVCWLTALQRAQGNDWHAGPDIADSLSSCRSERASSIRRAAIGQSSTFPRKKPQSFR